MMTLTIDTFKKMYLLAFFFFALLYQNCETISFMNVMYAVGLRVCGAHTCIFSCKV